MDQRGDFVDHDLPPARGPSLWMLFKTLVVFGGLGGLAYFVLFVPPIVAGKIWDPPARPLIVELLDHWS
jgi:hypothetical protein